MSGNNNPIDNILFMGAVLGGQSTSEAADAVDRNAHARLRSGDKMRIPISIRTANAQEIMESWGFVFTGKLDGLFQEVTAPPGWKMEQTDHAMWSKLLDADGCERGSMFYKAAIWDTDAFLNLTSRYKSSSDYHDSEYKRDTPEYDADRSCRNYAEDTKTGKRLWEGEWITNAAQAASYKDGSSAIPDGRGWLDEHFSDWRNPAAYWDAE